MPELGHYAVAVLGSYAIAIGLFTILIGWTIYQHVTTKHALEEAEARVGRNNV